MGSRAALAEIRIVNVTKEGKDSAFSSLCDKLARLPPTGFVAIDTEFSGLGTDPHLSHEDLKLRYASIRRLADTRAIFSIGISIFCPVTEPTAEPDLAQVDPVAEPAAQTYEVATYDCLMSCQDDFSTNANAGAFLVAHSFDFTRMFQKGIPYTRASTEAPPAAAGGKDVATEAMPWRWGKMPRGLLWRIGRQGVPVVLHNGLFDLAFLFAAFQGPLPPTLNGFVGALLECVPAGYWDSKMLASAAGERASFLGYLFANAVLKGRVAVRNCSGLPADEITDPPEEKPLPFAKDVLCALYSFRGFCPRGTACPFLHDPFLVVEQEKKGLLPKDSKEAHKRHRTQSKVLKRQKGIARTHLSTLSKKQRKRLLAERQRESSENIESMSSGPMVVADAAQARLETNRDKVSTRNEEKVHTAGWDAFCTGYVFAAYRASLPTEKLNKERNTIALAQKLSGLLLCKSSFAELDEAPSQNQEAKAAT